MPYKNIITDDIRELIRDNETKGKKIEKIYVNPKYQKEILNDREFTEIEHIPEQMAVRIAKFHNKIILNDGVINFDEIGFQTKDSGETKIYKRSQKPNRS
jgi:hypothetical protein